MNSRVTDQRITFAWPLVEFKCQHRKQKAWVHILADRIQLFLKSFFCIASHILNITYSVAVPHTKLNLIAQNSNE